VSIAIGASVPRYPARPSPGSALAWLHARAAPLPAHRLPARAVSRAWTTEEEMKHFGMTFVSALAMCCSAATLADVYHDYENFDEGSLGETFIHEGVTYHDTNMVDGYFPDGEPFHGPTDLHSEFIIEDATYAYDDFPDYGSPVKALTFGWVWITGPNLTIGPLASTWMDLDELGTDVSFDLMYYENGPWGGIEYVLDAYLDGDVVASDSFIISDLGGRDNPTFTTMSIRGAEFDQLHLYALLDGDYTAPRGMIDDLTITIIPEPAGLALLGAGALLALRRRS
jgi:hypothetical protein